MTGLLTRAQNNSMALVMKWIGLVVAALIVVPFPHGNVMHCSDNWRNIHERLGLHSSLGLGMFDDPKSTYWVLALMRPSQQLCHS